MATNSGVQLESGVSSPIATPTNRWHWAATSHYCVIMLKPFTYRILVYSILLYLCVRAMVNLCLTGCRSICV